jgi:hypothetical protein
MLPVTVLLKMLIEALFDWTTRFPPTMLPAQLDAAPIWIALALLWSVVFALRFLLQILLCAAPDGMDWTVRFAASVLEGPMENVPPRLTVRLPPRLPFPAVRVLGTGTPVQRGWPTLQLMV